MAENGVIGPFKDSLAPDYEGWEAALKELVRSRSEYDPVDMYCLRDRVKAKYHQPYFPEKEIVSRQADGSGTAGSAASGLGRGRRA